MGNTALKSDLPTIGIGNTAGYVVVMANPAWTEKRNTIEDTHKNTSFDHYMNFAGEFYDQYPSIIGSTSRTITASLTFLGDLFPNNLPNLSISSGRDKWASAHKLNMTGNWDLFPFHSPLDGISRISKRPEWLQQWLIESLKCLLRFNPKAVVIASKLGVGLACDLLGQTNFTYTQVEGIRLGFMKHRTTSVITISRQIFTQAQHPGYSILAKYIRELMA